MCKLFFITYVWPLCHTYMCICSEKQKVQKTKKLFLIYPVLSQPFYYLCAMFSFSSSLYSIVLFQPINVFYLKVYIYLLISVYIIFQPYTLALCVQKNTYFNVYSYFEQNVVSHIFGGISISYRRALIIFSIRRQNFSSKAFHLAFLTSIHPHDLSEVSYKPNYRYLYTQNVMCKHTIPFMFYV